MSSQYKVLGKKLTSNVFFENRDPPTLIWSKKPEVVSTSFLRPERNKSMNLGHHSMSRVSFKAKKGKVASNPSEEKTLADERN